MWTTHSISASGRASALRGTECTRTADAHLPTTAVEFRLRIRGVFLLCLPVCFLVHASAVLGQILPFEVKLDTIHRELRPDYCWFHPRVAVIPGTDPPTVICTLQKHLKVSDHYSGLYYMRSNDGGKSWTSPILPPELDWKTVDGETIAVCDVTPGWHRHSGRILAIGIKLRYSAAGDHLLDQPGSHQCAWAVYDPGTDRWTEWQMLQMPEQDTRHFLVAPGCVQWLVRPDGTLLIPMYFKSAGAERYVSTVLHCRFDGQQLTLIQKGDELALEDGRGLYEPSLAVFQGTYFLTLRNDSRGYVTTSQDGLHFAPIRPWQFSDQTELGSYNTQQHWLVHSQALFLSYTRRGANNDHIPRNRAPLFLAQVDPGSLQVLKETEQVLIPERGVMLGNFGAAAISPNESWVTDAEYLMSDKPHERGADGSVFAARVRWSQPSRLAVVSGHRRVVVLGDSITKGVRTGVTAEQTFGAVLQSELRKSTPAIEVINLGIGGERTDQALQRLARDVLSLEPEIVTIMYGTNDSYVDKGQSDSRISREMYSANLRRLISELRHRGIQPVLMTEPRWGDKAASNGAGEHPNIRLDLYMSACREVAADTNVPLIDHFRIWSDANAAGTDVGTWTTDQCHPDPGGHRVLADSMLPVIRELLAVD